MIRKSDIEKCRFFTTTGGDVWKVKKVKFVTEVELANCETGQTETCRVAEQSAEKFVAIAMPTVFARRGRPRITRAAPAKLAGKKAKSKKRKIKPAGQAPSLRKGKRGTTKGKPPSSQYLGVTVKQTKSGPRYYAQANRKGKYKSLGAYNVDELAAAAVQEHLGNKDEAERLRKMARQKTDTAIKELKGQVGQTRFLCSGCGADYGEEPDKCKKCGGGSFEEVQPDAKKKVS